MAVGKEIGQFAFKVTSITYGETSSQINLRGTATGFGTVEGTLTTRGEPGAKSGTCSWRGAGYLEDGTIVGGSAEGTWETIGKHKWRIRGLNYLSDGRTIATDGEAELATQAYSGKLYEWS
jgi:hypothetical protein